MKKIVVLVIFLMLMGVLVLEMVTVINMIKINHKLPQIEIDYKLK